MNIYITLDYELFFGEQSGSVEKCIIEPTEQLLQICDPLDVKFVCFVDAGYLWALEKFKTEFKHLEQDFHKVSAQIKKLSNQGHGIELHVHPHWEDSYYDGTRWVFDTSRYKLADFSDNDVMDIVTRYTGVLKNISGIAPVAYRAGGWSAQPFEPIKRALEANNIVIDSTVYPGGYYNSSNQVFDFRSVPDNITFYKFSDDLTTVDDQGDFTEIPISSQRVSPFFFWKFVLEKFRKQPQHKSFGNGSAVKMTKKQILRLLIAPSHTVVAIDGYKAKLIERAFKRYQKITANKGNFVLIGHPKAFTPYSLEKLRQFIHSTHTDHNFITFKS